MYNHLCIYLLLSIGNKSYELNNNNNNLYLY